MSMAGKNCPQYLVGMLGYTSKRSNLSVKSVIEINNAGHANAIGWVIVKDTVSGDMINMLQSSVSLRGLSYGARELLKKGNSGYEDYTDPSLAGAAGKKKRLTLNEKQSHYYINVSEGDKEVSYALDAYGLLAFADQLRALCEETDKMLFWHQRELAEQAKRNTHASMSRHRT